MLATIRQWVIKTMMKGQTGVVQTLPRQEIIELNTQIIAERIMRNGINPEDLKSVNQVENAVNAIESSEKKNLAENIRSGIGSTKSAKVFDMEGKEIPKGSQIMGGKEIKESDAAIKARLDADNKKGIASIKNNKMIDDAIDDASPGFADGDTKYDAELVAENLAERRGLVYDDLSPKERSKIYGEAYDALSRQRFSNRKKPKGDDPEEKADGGRIGFFTGMRAQEQKQKSSTNREKGIMSRGLGPKGTTGNITNFKETPVERPDNRPDNRPTVLAPETKNIIRKTANTAGDISYLKNLIELNPAGIVKNIGGKIILDKIFGDQSKLNTEEEDDTMQMAELSKKQLDFLNKPINQKSLKDESFGLTPKQIFDKLPSYEEKPLFGPNQEPTTPEEFNEYLKSIGVTQTVKDGGRIGYKVGSVDKMRRLILKAMGAGTAGIAGAKSGIFSFGKGAGKEVAKEVAQQTTTSTPPPYFFKLAEKIKMLGDDATATTDRTIAKTLKSKDGKSTYLLEEDVATGDTIIKKINKEGDEMITDVEIMELKKGEVVMGKDGKPIKTPDEYEEVTEANARIEGDTFNDPYYTDGIQVDDIIKEVDDKVPSIKYATGGLAYMLGE